MPNLQQRDKQFQGLLSKPSNVVADLAGIMSMLDAQRVPQETTPLPVVPALQPMPTAPVAAPTVFDRIAGALPTDGGSAPTPNFMPSFSANTAMGMNEIATLSGIMQAEGRAKLQQDQLAQRKAEAAQQQAQFEQGQTLAVQEMNNRVAEANWKNQMSRIKFKKELSDASPQELRKLDAALRAYSAGKQAVTQAKLQELTAGNYRANDAASHLENLERDKARAALYGGKSGKAPESALATAKRYMDLAKQAYELGDDDATAMYQQMAKDALSGQQTAGPASDPLTADPPLDADGFPLVKFYTEGADGVMTEVNKANYPRQNATPSISNPAMPPLQRAGKVAEIMRGWR